MKYLIIIFATTLLFGCNSQQDYDGTNAKEYWHTHCKDKSSEIRDTENCRRSLKDLRIQRIG